MHQSAVFKLVYATQKKFYCALCRSKQLWERLRTFEYVYVIAFKRENESRYTTAKAIKALEGFIIEADNGYE